MSSNHDLRSLAARQHGLLNRRQAHDLGVSYRNLERKLARGDWKPISPEVLELFGTPETDEKAAMGAVLDSPPGAVLSHVSAAAIWELPGFHLSDPIHVTVPRQGVDSRRRLAIVHFQKDFPLDHVVWLRGVPVASPALTIFHLAGSIHPARTERALDNAWAMDLVNGPTLHSLLARLAARGRNGIRLMRELIDARADGFVPPESGNEARYISLIKEAGLPLPRRQIVVGRDAVVGRVDFLFDEVDGVVEVLSRRYHTSKLDQEADMERFEALTRIGMRVLTVWDDELWQRPQDAVARTRLFLHELGHPQLFSRGDPTL